MKLAGILAMFLAVTLWVGHAMAVPPGKTAEYPAPIGKVTLDGKVHADKGLKCNDCHTKIFQMKKGAGKTKMADINAGKGCGTCHNGEKAFKASDPKNCMRCHKK